MDCRFNQEENIDDIEEEINEFIDDELADLGQKIMDKFKISEKTALSELKGHVGNKESF